MTIMDDGEEYIGWSDMFDMRAAERAHELLKERVKILEERVDSLLDYINDLNVIQPTPMVTFIPKNRRGNVL